jgi:hypothetical protein
MWTAVHAENNASAHLRSYLRWPIAIKEMALNPGRIPHACMP